MKSSDLVQLTLKEATMPTNDNDGEHFHIDRGTEISEEVFHFPNQFTKSGRRRVASFPLKVRAM